MKLIDQSAFKYLSVKLPAMGAFLLLVIIPALQWALDFQIIPKEHHAVIIGVILPILTIIGKKIYQPELHEPQLPINTLISTNNDLAWMIEAKKHIGLREINGTNKHPTILEWCQELNGVWVYGQAWCGTYVAHCLKTAGIKYPKNWYRALDYLNYGAPLQKPAYGCVAIKTRKGGGHVCFVVGRNKAGKLVCLGGNQGNAVSYALYNESEFEEFRWYGKTSRPAEHRYNLPLLNGVSATKVSES